MNPMNLQLRLQPAPADLVRTAVGGESPSVYVSAPYRNGSVPGRGECVWTNGELSVFVKAHHSEDGLVIDLRVVVDPPRPPAEEAALAA
jgi:hypothetical protein